jgi:hypothetical protein
MKLEVEIKDEKFRYTYKIGENEQTGESNLTPDAVIMFSRLLQEAYSIWNTTEEKKVNKWMREILEREYKK